MDKYLAKFTDTDFLAGHANYFNMNQFHSADDSTSETMIRAIEAQEGFLEGGRLYYNIGDCSIEQPNREGETINKAKDGKPMLQLYGLDKLPLSHVDVYEGELDLEKLATGKYIIEGVFTDDDNNILPNSSNYAVGDIVKINVDGILWEFEVLCKIKIAYYSNSVRYILSNYNLYYYS